VLFEAADLYNKKHLGGERMDLLINSILITALSTVNATLSQPDVLPIAEFFSSLILAALPHLLRTSKNPKWHRFTNGCAALFILVLVLLSWSSPAFLYFIPLLVGSIDRIPYLYAVAAVLLSWIQHPPPVHAAALLVLTTALAYILAYRTRRELGFTRKHFDTVDDQKRRVRDLHRQNRELIANRELEMSNARLRERNRISTEIHDNVGHLLSSSILQVGALETIASESERPYIKSLQQTLTDAMQQIRDSVHDIHRDSLDIRRELLQIQKKYSFCRMTSTVAIEHEPDAKVHYTLLAIVREALTNTMKHSDATLVTVSLTESARQYNMIVTDNGKPKDTRPAETTGIGLVTMEDRVRGQGGTIHISTSDGFRIFVSLPATKKEEKT
jgi:signal transduction histidine kinase